VSVVADVLVELNEVGDLLDDDLSDDDTTGLRENALRRKDASIDSGNDLDGSSRSNDVVNDLRSASESGVSLERDVSSSNDVNDPLSVNVAVGFVFPSGLGEVAAVDGDVVDLGVDVIADDVDLRSVIDGGDRVVGDRGKRGGIASVAVGAGVEVSV